MEAAEDYLEHCAHVKVDLGSGEFAEAGKPRVLSKVRPEVLDEKRQPHFPALQHIREAEPLRGKLKTMAGESRKQWCMAREWAKRGLPQQSSSSVREEEGHWVLMEDRRRRGVAFENLAKDMLRDQEK